MQSADEFWSGPDCVTRVIFLLLWTPRSRLPVNVQCGIQRRSEARFPLWFLPSPLSSPSRFFVVCVHENTTVACWTSQHGIKYHLTWAVDAEQMSAPDYFVEDFTSIKMEIEISVSDVPLRGKALIFILEPPAVSHSQPLFKPTEPDSWSVSIWCNAAREKNVFGIIDLIRLWFTEL